MLWKETAIANLDISDMGWLALRDILLLITVYVDCEYPYKGLYIEKNHIRIIYTGHHRMYMQVKR